MPKLDAVVISIVVVVVAVVAVLAFLFLGTDISVYVEQHPPGGAI